MRHLRGWKLSWISIHALREEGDQDIEYPCKNAQISIHALREEGDTVLFRICAVLCRFLSTPSARRATEQHQNHPATAPISIHALREEGDCRLSLKCREPALFLSTPSARRATQF